MMPYRVYQLYQIERPKSAAEIRLADERLGKAAASVSRLWRRAAEPIAVVRAPYRASVPPISRQDCSQPALAVAGSAKSAVASTDQR